MKTLSNKAVQPDFQELTINQPETVDLLAFRAVWEQTGGTAEVKKNLPLCLIHKIPATFNHRGIELSEAVNKTHGFSATPIGITEMLAKAKELQITSCLFKFTTLVGGSNVNIPVSKEEQQAVVNARDNGLFSKTITYTEGYKNCLTLQIIPSV